MQAQLGTFSLSYAKTFWRGWKRCKHTLQYTDMSAKNFKVCSGIGEGKFKKKWLVFFTTKMSLMSVLPGHSLVKKHRTTLTERRCDRKAWHWTVLSIVCVFTCHFLSVLCSSCRCISVLYSTTFVFVLCSSERIQKNYPFFMFFSGNQWSDII